MRDPMHVHIPFSQWDQHFPLLLKHRLQPELAFKWPDLDPSLLPAVKRAGQQLAEEGLGVTVHAPFMDLNPGAIEPLVREATRQRWMQTLEVAELLQARLVVLHPGFDRWRYGGQSQPWIDACLDFLPPLLEQAASQECLLVLENIFEETPDTLAAVLKTLDSPWLGHCFDAGHWNLFAKCSMEQWFEALAPWIRHLHIHDNSGDRDAHLAIGEGNIDFPLLFDYMKNLQSSPSMTLEIHDCEALLRCVGSVKSLLPR
ncbi:TIM barrel protein, AP endonuclease family 2/xylose isomerase-like family [Syntrophotalea carbinolica DSM 2380]|uniref:TIM barrel protein, AP endonuclease family 2/xylose isomerase-like family n=1 Tax=Syntrophotalea carbinolica (strain DSM 2380 / NBRC 103641 / GraBd1) TaxID=338963 RepID=Q39ZU4_SYNC1|nr:sugar phosphate isomerase/epimerase family protein [Syntrophotalea carbinolica]ABA90363.1 TIM barrel protein, AP endonuclease family 2/xylose isomerase-like family [Syntrophotalea carbinolica DSM 2380]